MGSQKKEVILWAANFVKIPTKNKMTASEAVSAEIDSIAWWKSHAMELSKWANAFRLVLLV